MTLDGYGREVFRYRPGTGATVVRDIVPGSRSSTPSEIVELGGELIFFTSDTEEPAMWVTNGTEAGTTERFRFPSSTQAIDSVHPIEGGARLLVWTSLPRAHAVWLTDGSAAGTELLLETSSITEDGGPVVDLGSQFCFVSGAGVMCSDGTLDHTYEVAGTGFSNPELVEDDGEIFFGPVGSSRNQVYRFRP